MRSLVLLLPLIACSGDEAVRARTPITVVVLDEGVTAGAPRAPLGNVEVAFDPPGGGERVLSRTGADGRVVFEADFTQGGAAVTAVSDGHVIVTQLDATGDVELVLPRLDTSIVGESVELRGAIAGKRAESEVDVSVGGLRRLGNDTAEASTYALRAPRGRPFFVLGHELVRTGNVNELVKSFRIESPALEADHTLDIDLTNVPSLPARTVHLRASGPGTSCSAIVESVQSRLLVGSIRSTHFESATCDVAINVVDTTIAPEDAVTRVVLGSPDGSKSVRIEPGVLADGASVDGFLTPPSIPEASRSLTDPIPIGGTPASVRVDVFAGGQLLWIASGRLRDGTLRMPRAPLTFTADVTLLALAVSIEEDPLALPSGAIVHRRAATSRDVIVRR